MEPLLHPQTIWIELERVPTSLRFPAMPMAVPPRSQSVPLGDAFDGSGTPAFRLDLWSAGCFLHYVFGRYSVYSPFTLSCREVLV